MITTLLIDLYSRELDRFKNEILAFENDELPWKMADGLNITAGNICLSLCGSLQHNIGNMIGDSGYIRNKEAEQKAKNITRERLVEEIENAKGIVVNTLEEISKSDLLKIFPSKEFEEPITTEYFLIHQLSQLSFSIGQISILRNVALVAAV